MYRVYVHAADLTHRDGLLGSPNYLKRNGRVWHFLVDKAESDAHNNPNQQEGSLAIPVASPPRTRARTSL